MKKRYLITILTAAVSLFANGTKEFKIPQNTNPGKICILVTDIGTIDTVAKTEEFLTKIKQFNVDSMPQISEADKAADPTLVRREINIRFNDNIRRYNEQQQEIVRQNRRMENILENLRTTIIGDKNKRDIVVGKQYLQSYLSPDSNYILLIDRSNTSLSEVEKAINGNDQQDLASACFFLTVIMQDMNTESNTVGIGGTMIKKTVYTQKAVGNLRDFNGNVVTAFHVVARSSRRQTSASRNVGHNPASDLIEDALKQIAGKIADYYLSNLEIKCTGPKGDDEFDEDAVTFMLDGQEFENGDKTVIGRHILSAEADGYRPITREIMIRSNRKKSVIKLKFKKLAPPKTGKADSGNEE